MSWLTHWLIPMALFLTVHSSIFQGKLWGSPWIASPRAEIVWSCLGTVACSCSIYLFMKVGIKCLLGPFHSTHLCPCRFQFSCGYSPDQAKTSPGSFAPDQSCGLFTTFFISKKYNFFVFTNLILVHLQVFGPH